MSGDTTGADNQWKGLREPPREAFTLEELNRNTPPHKIGET
jgi:hypothetical protein